MSTIQLSDGMEIDPNQIVSAALEQKGAKIDAKAASVASGDWQDLRVPEDSLVIRLKDGSEFVIRGEQEAKRAWDLLTRAKEQGNLNFSTTVNKPE